MIFSVTIELAPYTEKLDTIKQPEPTHYELSFDERIHLDAVYFGTPNNIIGLEILPVDSPYVKSQKI